MASMYIPENKFEYPIDTTNGSSLQMKSVENS